MIDNDKLNAMDRGAEALNRHLGEGRRLYERLNTYTEETRFHDGSVDQQAVEDYMDTLSHSQMTALKTYNDYANDSDDETVDRGGEKSTPSADTSKANDDVMHDRLSSFLDDHEYDGVTPTGLTLREVITKWIKYKVDQKDGWGKSSIKRNKPAIEKLEVLLDNCEARLVTDEMLRDKFIERRHQLPKALKKRITLHKGVRKVLDVNGKVETSLGGKAITTKDFIPSDEIIDQAEANGWETDSMDTIGRENGLIQAFLKWAKKQKYMRSGLDEVLDDYTKYTRESSRTIFTAKELKLMFESEDFQTGGLQKELHTYWIPLICLTTGARSGEASQLRTEDIAYQDTGSGESIWVIRFIADEDTTQTSKTGSSRRIVPIPQVLLDLNFLGFIEQVRVRNGEYLFPDLEPQTAGASWSDAISSWFHSAKRQTGYMERCGVEKEVKVEGIKKKRVFHSLRHTWITCAKNSGINKEMRTEISGHSQGVSRDAHDGYSHDYNLELRHDAINQVDFGIDWSKIANWQG